MLFIVFVKKIRKMFLLYFGSVTRTTVLSKSVIYDPSVVVLAKVYSYF